MKAAEYGYYVDASLRLDRPWTRLSVSQSLVRTRFVVEADVLGEHPPEMILIEDEDVVQRLSPERADEPFSEGIHVRRESIARSGLPAREHLTT